MKEAGFDGADAMGYPTLPGPFAPPLEKLVVDKVRAPFWKAPLPE